MSKRPRTESSNCQEDIWGDDFTYDEVNSISNIETLASQPYFPGKKTVTIKSFFIISNYL